MVSRVFLEVGFRLGFIRLNIGVCGKSSFEGREEVV